MATNNDKEKEADELFLHKTISEIRNVERKTRLDIENKKEELRQLVGERYRDMIESADSVISMKEQTLNIMTSLEEIYKNCQKIQQVHFLKGTGGRQAPPTTTLKTSCGSMYQLIFELKDMIYININDGHYLCACGRFILSQHVISLLRVMGVTWPRLFYQIWDGVTDLKELIIESCHAKLQHPHLEENVVLECCTVLILMERYSLEKLLTTFLTNKEETVRKVFETSTSKSIRETVKDLLHVIMTTLSYVNELWCIPAGMDKSKLMTSIDKVVYNESDSFFVCFIPSSLLPSLPESVKSYRMRDWVRMNDIDNQNNLIKEWLDKCVGLVESSLTDSLSHVSTLKGLGSLRQSIYAFLSKGVSTDSEDVLTVKLKWSKLCSNVIKEDISLYQYYLQPLLLEQAKLVLLPNTFLLIRSFSPMSIIGGLFQRINSDSLVLLHDLIDTDTDTDISRYLWSTDLVSSDSYQLSLQMKCHGCTPHLLTFCQNYNDILNVVIEELKSFAQAPPTLPSVSDSNFPFDWYKDVELINEHVNEHILRFIDKFLEEVDAVGNSLLAEMKDNPILRDDNINKILLLGRLCHCLIHFCPNLQLLTNQLHSITSCNKLKSSKIKLSDNNKLAVQLKHKTSKLYGHWVQYIINKIEIQLVDSDVSTLTNIMNWESISIREESDKGVVVSSQVHLPSQASLYISTTLFALCQEMTRVGGHRVDRSILELLNKGVFNKILTAIRDLVCDLNVPQHCSLQLLFDVQYVALVLAPPGWKDEWNDLYVKYEDITNNLKEHIDPFDYDVYQPHLNKLIERQYQRSTVLLGMLVMNRGQLLSGPGKYHYSSNESSVSGTTSYDEKHVVLPLSTSLPRLSSLPYSGTSKAASNLPLADSSNNCGVTSFSNVVSFLQHY